MLALPRLVPRDQGTVDLGTAVRDKPAPIVAGATLDGGTISLAGYLGRPVVLNFWGPSCIPCREEFPLFTSKLREHAGDGLVILGVLMDDPPGPARDFVAEMGATWPTVIDPDDRFQRAYQVVGRPQSYLIDAEGIVRAIQVGAFTDQYFEAQYATIAPSS